MVINVNVNTWQGLIYKWEREQAQIIVAAVKKAFSDE